MRLSVQAALLTYTYNRIRFICDLNMYTLVVLVAALADSNRFIYCSNLYHRQREI